MAGVAAKHKLSGQYQYGQQDRPFYGYSLGQTLASPEAAYASKSIPSYLGQVGWNAPMTSRVLFEAGAAVANKNFFTFLQPVAGNNPSYQESSTGNFWGNSRSTYGQNANWQMNTRCVDVVRHRLARRQVRLHLPASGVAHHAGHQQQRRRC